MAVGLLLLLGIFSAVHAAPYFYLPFNLSVPPSAWVWNFTEGEQRSFQVCARDDYPNQTGVLILHSILPSNASWSLDKSGNPACYNFTWNASAFQTIVCFFAESSPIPFVSTIQYCIKLQVSVIVRLSVYNLPKLNNRNQWFALPSTSTRRTQVIRIKINSTLPYSGTLFLYAQRYPLSNDSGAIQILNASATFGSPFVDFELHQWGVEELGQYVIIVNSSATSLYEMAKRKFYVIFHFFPPSGRFVLPLDNALVGNKVTIYNKNWEKQQSLNVTKPNAQKFFGFTIFRMSDLVCGNHQVLSQQPATTTAGELVRIDAWIGVSLIERDLQIGSQNLSRAVVRKFAVIENPVITPLLSSSSPQSSMIRLSPGPAQTVTGKIWGTYCIDSTKFKTFR